MKFIEKHINLFGILLLVVSFLSIFWQFVSLQNAFFFTDISSDTLNVFYPKLAQISNYLQQEGLPRWSFNHGLGMNIYGSLNQATFMLVLFGKDFIPYAIFLTMSLYLFLGAWFCQSYFKLIGCPPTISWFCALLFWFSGVMMVGASWYATLYQSLLFIFGLWCIESFLVKKNWYWLVLFGFLVATPAKLHQFGLLFSAYLIFRYFYFKKDAIAIEFKQMLHMAAYATLGVLMALPIFVSKFITMYNSPRISGEASYTSKLLQEHPLWLDSEEFYNTFLARLFSVDLWGVGSDYEGWYNYLEAPIINIGLVGLLLFLLFFFTINNKRKLLCFSTFFAIIVLLQLIPIFRFSFWLLSGNYIRILSQMLTFVLIFGVSQGLFSIYKNEKLKWWQVLFSGCLLLCLFLLASLYSTNVNPFVQLFCMLALGFSFIIVMPFSFKKISFNLFLYGLMSLLFVEGVILNSYSYKHRETVAFSSIEARKGYNDYSKEALAYIKANDSTPFYRIEKNYTSSPAQHKGLNDALVQNYYGTSILASFNNLNYVNFLNALDVIDSKKEVATRWIKGLIERPLLNFFVSTKYKLSDKGNQFVGAGYTLKNKIENIEIYENNWFLPLGFCYDKIMLEQDFLRLQPIQKDIALFNSVIINDALVLEGNYTKTSVAAIPQGSDFTADDLSNNINQLKKNVLAIEHFEQSRIQGNIELNEPKILFFSIPFDNGWKLLVNGQPHPLQTLNIGFMGTEIPKGKHQIELYFKYPLIEYGSYLSYFLVMAFGGCLVFMHFKSSVIKV